MITADEFVKAYNSYPPTKINLFFHKYFSGDNVAPENKWLSRSYETLLILLFMGGMVGAIIGKMEITKIFTIALLAALVGMAIPFIFTWYQQLFRIRKIRKKLGVSRIEYADLVRQYGHLIK